MTQLQQSCVGFANAILQITDLLFRPRQLLQAVQLLEQRLLVILSQFFGLVLQGSYRCVRIFALIQRRIQVHVTSKIRIGLVRMIERAAG